MDTIASLNTSIDKDYYLDTLLIGIKPIKNCKNNFNNELFDDFVIKLDNPTFFLIVGILNICKGRFSSSFNFTGELTKGSSSESLYT